MKRLMPLAAVAATTAALAFAVPAARAEAATPPALQPGSLPCQLLAAQIRFATAFHFTGLATVLSNVFVRSGCGGAAI